jgi:hypothetical protein
MSEKQIQVSDTFDHTKLLRNMNLFCILYIHYISYLKHMHMIKV